MTTRLLNLPVTAPDGRANRVLTIGELLHEAAETHLDHRHLRLRTCHLERIRDPSPDPCVTQTVKERPETKP